MKLFNLEFIRKIVYCEYGFIKVLNRNIDEDMRFLFVFWIVFIIVWYIANKCLIIGREYFKHNHHYEDEEDLYLKMPASFLGIIIAFIFLVERDVIVYYVLHVYFYLCITVLMINLYLFVYNGLKASAIVNYIKMFFMLKYADDEKLKKYLDELNKYNKKRAVMLGHISRKHRKDYVYQYLLDLMADKSEVKKIYAIKAMENQEGERVVKSIRMLLADRNKNVRIHAANSLYELGEKKWKAVITGDIYSDIHAVRQIEDIEFNRHLLKMLRSMFYENFKNNNSEREIADLIVYICRKHNDLIPDKPDLISAGYFSEKYTKEEMYQFILGMMNESIDEHKFFLIDTFRSQNNKIYIEPLELLLADKNDDIRVKAAEMLYVKDEKNWNVVITGNIYNDIRAVRQIKDIEFNRQLLKILRDMLYEHFNNNEKKREIVEDIVFIYEKSSDLIPDKPDLVSAGYFSEKYEKEEIYQFILGMMNESSNEYKLFLIDAIGNKNNKMDVEPLKLFLADRNDDVRVKVAESLYKLGEANWKKVITGNVFNDMYANKYIIDIEYNKLLLKTLTTMLKRESYGWKHRTKIAENIIFIYKRFKDIIPTNPDLISIITKPHTDYIADVHKDIHHKDSPASHLDTEHYINGDHDCGHGDESTPHYDKSAKSYTEKRHTDSGIGLDF